MSQQFLSLQINFSVLFQDYYSVTHVPSTEKLGCQKLLTKIQELMCNFILKHKTHIGALNEAA